MSTGRAILPMALSHFCRNLIFSWSRNYQNLVWQLFGRHLHYRMLCSQDIQIKLIIKLGFSEALAVSLVMHDAIRKYHILVDLESDVMHNPSIRATQSNLYRLCRRLGHSARINELSKRDRKIAVYILKKYIGVEERVATQAMLMS